MKNGMPLVRSTRKFFSVLTALVRAQQRLKEFQEPGVNQRIEAQLAKVRLVLPRVRISEAESDHRAAARALRGYNNSLSRPSVRELYQ